MKEEKESKDSVENLAKRRGIYYPAFEIYGEIGGFYDYGPIGVRIRNNYINLWRKIFVEQLGAHEVDTTTIMPEPVFKASGHLDSFTDPVIRCTHCKSAHRADKLLEEFYIKKKEDKAGEIEKMDAQQLQKEITKHGIKCPKCGTALSGKVEVFNMLFKTAIGAAGTESGYLRPETPQGIFIDFRYLFRTYSMKLPIAIAQTGNVYRNEISPRQQLIRMREFKQMDIELFFDPESEDEIEGFDESKIAKEKIPVLLKGKEKEETITIKDLLTKKIIPNKHFALLLYLENSFAQELGLKEYRFRNVEVTPHYSKCNFDLELKTSFGYVELSGLAYRTDYDLTSHSKLSKQDLSVMNGEKKVLPHVVELSIGVDRPFFCILDSAMQDGKDRGWGWLHLSESLVPYKYGVFPLQKDDKLIAKAKEIFKKVNGLHSSYYSETGSIGKRYARADEIGVPNCITIDYQTLEDNTFTIRNIKTAQQTRAKISDIK